VVAECNSSPLATILPNVPWIEPYVGGRYNENQAPSGDEFFTNSEPWGGGGGKAIKKKNRDGTANHHVWTASGVSGHRTRTSSTGVPPGDITHLDRPNGEPSSPTGRCVNSDFGLRR